MFYWEGALIFKRGKNVPRGKFLHDTISRGLRLRECRIMLDDKDAEKKDAEESFPISQVTSWAVGNE